jgi:site-specific DNA recombinase
MRAVIYARYSSDLQRETSIEDQIEVCRRHADARGWTILRQYSDRAASGSTKFRPGYQDLLAAARRREFDVVLAEALDRLSRDQEDVAALFKTLTFHGVQLMTLAEGAITELHVGLKGTMNALFLKDLSAKPIGACAAGSRKSAPPGA